MIERDEYVYVVQTTNQLVCLKNFESIVEIETQLKNGLEKSDKHKLKEILTGLKQEKVLEIDLRYTSEYIPIAEKILAKFEKNRKINTLQVPEEYTEGISQLSTELKNEKEEMTGSSTTTNKLLTALKSCPKYEPETEFEQFSTELELFLEIADISKTKIK